MNKNRNMFIVFLVGFVIGVLGFTGCFLLYLKSDKPMMDIEPDKKDVDNKVSSDIVFSSIDNSIFLEDVIPTLDKFGIDGKGFSFSIRNNGANEKQYQLKLVDDNSTINNSHIRYELIKNGKVLGVYTLADDGNIEKSSITSGDEIHYVIKLWLDYNSNVKSGRFSKKIAIEELSNETIEIDINKPNLTNGMIPVYYDNSTNSWNKADANNNDNKWYNYKEQKWANVVTVNSEKREYYINSEVGTKIDSNDINSMWVWIPRFSYNLNDGNINVDFVNKDKDAYQAFTFNNQSLEGIWMTKFESGMKEDSECISSSLTKKCNDSNNKLYFVPNYSFATKMTMANMFYAIRKMELKNNIYGFSGTGSKLNNDGTINNDKNDFDIHMIRNSEWQAVAILSSSKYGKSGNNIYDNDHKSVINNNSTYTGKSYYNNEEFDYNAKEKGEAASTTGNVTGIYDMAGGKREYVMINNDDLNIFSKKSNSGFTTKVKEYYYDNGFVDSDSTYELKDKYGSSNLINNEPVTRGGYKNTGNIFNLYGANDYIDKISVETNSRASLVVIKGE